MKYIFAGETITDEEIERYKLLKSLKCWNCEYIELAQRIGNIGQKIRNSEDIQGVGDGGYTISLSTDELSEKLNHL